MPDLNVVNFFRIAKSNGTEFIAGMKQFVELIESESSAGLDSILPILNAHPSLANLDAAAIAKLKVLANFTSKVSAEMLANVSKYIQAIRVDLQFGDNQRNGNSLANRTRTSLKWLRSGGIWRLSRQRRMPHPWRPGGQQDQPERR